MAIYKKWVRHPPKGKVGSGAWINISEGTKWKPTHLTYKNGEMNGKKFVQIEEGVTGTDYKEWWVHPPQQVIDWIIPVAVHPEEAPPIPPPGAPPYTPHWQIVYTFITIDGVKKVLMHAFWDPITFVATMKAVLKINAILRDAGVEVEPLEHLVPPLEVLEKIPPEYIRELPKELIEKLPRRFIPKLVEKQEKP